MLILMRSRQRAAVARFEAAGAVSPATARTLAQIGERGGWVFSDMAERGVFVRISEDRWYLSAEGLRRFRGRQSRDGLIALAVVGVAIGLLVIARALW
jgi:hypothetical protein